MNLVLFEAEELSRPLHPDDARHVHIKRVLRRARGEVFDCGVVNGSRGKATIAGEDAAGMQLLFTWAETPPPLDPLTFLIALPRPQTARRILRELCSRGRARHFDRPGRRQMPR